MHAGRTRNTSGIEEQPRLFKNSGRDSVSACTAMVGDCLAVLQAGPWGHRVEPTTAGTD